MPKKKKKDNWVDRLKKKVKGYFAKQKETQRKWGEGMQKVGGYKKKKKKKESFKTKRTADIEKRLKKSGLSDKEIAKLRGKKKSSHNSHNSSSKSGGY
jgi:hypothetical protein